MPLAQAKVYRVIEPEGRLAGGQTIPPQKWSSVVVQ